ncbi:MAG: hypothetical protein HY876_08060 [Coriobacteriales bacterium]|nr:hypothetical protein [Coriobacteriales bacterium]
MSSATNDSPAGGPPDAPPPPGGWASTSGSTAVAEPEPQPESGQPPRPPGSGGTQTPDGGEWRGYGGGGRPRGVVVGIVLVVAGAILLLANVVPGLGFAEFWPAIIIALGLVEVFTPGRDWRPRLNRVFDGFVTVTIGSLLLACTTGYLPWSIWWSILSLWPVLLISVGLGIFGRGIGARWLGALGSLLVIAALLYGALVLPGGPAVFSPGISFGRAGVPFEHTAEYPAGFSAAGRAKLRLVNAAGTVDISGGGTQLAQVTGSAPEQAQPRFSQTRGAQPTVRVSTPEGRQFYVPGARGLDMDIELGRAVWDLDLDTGVGNLDADLAEVRLRRLRVNTGVSAAQIRLGQPAVGRRVPVTIEAGVSGVTVTVPRGVAARLRVEGGIAGTNVSRDFEKLGNGIWIAEGRSPGYDIHVKAGVGSVTVDTYEEAQ